jgi:Fic/DOC family protein
MLPVDPVVSREEAVLSRDGGALAMTNSDPLAEKAVSSYRGRPLPEPAWPVGYAALIERYDLQVVVPRRLTAIAPRYRKAESERWLLLSRRSLIEGTLGSHLTTALKWEGVDLGVLAALFRAVDPTEVVDFITERPKSGYGRRVWFLYEWLTENELPISDLGKARAIDVLDPAKQFCLEKGKLSARHRVLNNLPGTPSFCPLVLRSRVLEGYDFVSLRESIQAVRDGIHPDVLARAAAFLELKDSRASFHIEGEAAPANRIRRWGQAIGRAGKTKLTLQELLGLQGLLIGDDRFVRPGLRLEGGFVGEHDRWNHAPLPDHIDARPDDLEDLVHGVIDYIDRSLAGGIDPVVVAAAVAFGLVYIHPFEDGNGRLHRWLFHHVLAIGGATPFDLVFPVSSVIQRRLGEYRATLESYSKPLLPLIEWEETDEHNVQVTNDTADFYRYFDATPHSEFLYSCVEETVNKDVPEEVEFLGRRDLFRNSVQQIIDLPQRTEEQLFRFLHQNSGRLSRTRRSREFEKLRDDEVEEIEGLYASVFGEGEDV